MFLYVDGGGVPDCAFFSYKLYDQRNTPIKSVSMSMFKLINLGTLLPERCVITDELGRQTNNIAEYCSVFYGLKRFLEVYGQTPLTLYHDSQLVQRQIAGKLNLPGIEHYQCNTPHLAPWLEEIASLWYSGITYKWVKRDVIVARLGH